MIKKEGIVEMMSMLTEKTKYVENAMEYLNMYFSHM